MKKIIFILFVVAALASLAVAQGPVGTYVPTQDVLGAHTNGGRGCAGCHAPHSGAAGNGGNAVTNPGPAGAVIDNALFGQDLGPIYGQTFTFGKGSSVTFGAALDATNAEEFRSIGMCLACHDGAIAKGAMMTGQAYEQRVGMLPATYGSGKIPSLLAADGGYTNDHPVGPVKATAGDASLAKYYNITIDATTKAITGITPKTQAVTDFVAGYGMPALAGTSWSYGLVNPEGNVDVTKPFVACTTCHNQHVMNVYKAPVKAGITAPTGTFKTYFFINGAYNVDALNQTGTLLNNTAPSTAQFCRQCHFGEANENYGLKLPTAF